MEDKDKFGEKLRDRRKASEDLFIAEQDRKLIERLSERLRQSAAASARSGACPRDGAKLVTRNEKGVTIDFCPTCHGMWLDKGDVQTVVKQKNETAVIHWIRSIFGG
jgi:hypothetical protein